MVVVARVVSPFLRYTARENESTKDCPNAGVKKSEGGVKQRCRASANDSQSLIAVVVDRGRIPNSAENTEMDVREIDQPRVEATGFLHDPRCDPPDFYLSSTTAMNFGGLKAVAASRQPVDDPLKDNEPAAAAMAGHIDAGPSSAASSSASSSAPGARPSSSAAPGPEGESLIDQIMKSK